MNKNLSTSHTKHMLVDAVETFEFIREKLHHAGDLKSRQVQFFGCKVCVCYIADLVDPALLYDSILNPITTSRPCHPKSNSCASGNMPCRSDSHMCHPERSEGSTAVAALQNILSSVEVTKIFDPELLTEKLLTGQALILVSGADSVLACDIEKVAVRAISEPPSSVVIKGPREGFNESVKSNLALIRQRARTDDLVVKMLTVGELTKTQVAVVYFDSLADQSVVRQVLATLEKIKIDGVVDSHYLVSFLQKNPKSLFKQIGDTEKPDILIAKMLEGRLGIIVDGSPIVLTLPYIIIEDLQNSDDYYSQPIGVSFVRVLRLVGVVLAVLLPGVYVALEKFHYKIIPTELLVTIINTTAGIPFSPFVELLFIVLLFEILYEANLRMPQYLGTAVSIVGALILGDTAINAGLVSPPAVMIVALSGITFYIIPAQASQFSILRLVALVVGACLGLFGLLLFCVFVLSYLSNFDSYKSAYLAPTAPYIKSDQKDLFVRTTIKDMTRRPRSIANNRHNLDRTADDQ